MKHLLSLRRLPRHLLAPLALTATLAAQAQAQAPATPAAAPAATAAAGGPRPTISVSPIYSQIVAFTLPAGFKPVHEKDHGTHYIREAVPDGESVEKWTQMITVTGLKGYAANPQASVTKFADTVAQGFQRACPKSFDAVQVTEGKLPGGQPAFTALISCGSHTSGSAATGESVLLTVIQGEKDYYTLQWAERYTAVDNTPPKPDMARWSERLKALFPIRVCAITPGEPPPYRSCVSPR